MYSCLHWILKYSGQKGTFCNIPVLLWSWAHCCQRRILPHQSWLSWMSPVLNILDERTCASFPDNCGGESLKQLHSGLSPDPFLLMCSPQGPLATHPVVAVSLLSLTVGASCLPGHGHSLLLPRSTVHPGLCVNLLKTAPEGDSHLL